MPENELSQVLCAERIMQKGSCECLEFPRSPEQWGLVVVIVVVAALSVNNRGQLLRGCGQRAAVAMAERVA